MGGDGEPTCVHYTYMSLHGNPRHEDSSKGTSPSHSSNPRQAQIVAQKLQYGVECFVLHEVFGANSNASASEEGGNPDCVICLSEPRDTAVLPCRHMCFCSYC